MNYEALRHFADSWGLLFMTGVFLTLIGWTFRPGAGRHHEAAADMIFDEDKKDV
ncbi:MAG: cytochrome c oxidase cbb3-type subunit 4 [Parasphingorhabdus sp.]|jgi:cytochrome c oxidase cbb3-type subunit 4|uniref:cbb3-type cytochrome c oxidase subunit 3 n=1 Tax=Parasphingorhabdus sp. TaxID=2709688 RepID=UPI001B55DED8|nr:cbb3-type cytochrome c oxidase subunit 3 [Parasphingorhabdus sp.]MBQ0771588.1 cbb3-type cytochrome c oxidase subunit 3 [Sphingomonadales bacterium]|tara:strand:+ start:941 stop:1102 length:162 start_codon:yes stop_codon:yes gene_type:complete